MQRDAPNVETVAAAGGVELRTEAPRSGVSTLLALLAAASIEISAFVGIALAAPRQWWLLVPLHLLIVAGLALHVVLLRRRGRETTFAMLGTLGLAAVGPLGALGSMTLALLSGRRGPDTGLLEAWYDRIAMSVAVDPVSRFCDNVSSGRTINLEANAPPSYAVVVASGTLAERQNVLGLIARRFHPDYLPVLASALRSSEPVIRVQAAAVAAHVRPAIARLFREAVASLPAASTTAATALALLRDFESMNESGLLDESDRRQGVDIIERLGDVVLSRVTAGDAPVPRTATLEERMALEDTLERLFLRRQRYSELRTSRNARRVLSGRRTARIRRMTAQPVKARGVA